MILNKNSFYSEKQIKVINGIVNKIIKRKQIILLAGKAGTGKTTILKAIVDIFTNGNVDKRRILLLTPTGKASVVLNQKTNTPAQTIHSAIYGSIVEGPDGKLIWLDPQIAEDRNTLVIVDEASMVGKKLYDDLIEALPDGASILFVGDYRQVDPVKDDIGAFANPIDFELTTIHRQAIGNPIIQLANQVADGKNFYQWMINYKSNQTSQHLALGYGVEEMAELIASDVQQNADSVAVTFTKKACKDLNVRVRELLGFRGLPKAGERIIIRANNNYIGYKNGEIYTVEKASYYRQKNGTAYMILKLKERKTPLRINPKMIGADRNKWFEHMRFTKTSLPKNYTLIDYGYALTIHSSQGSEWNQVYFLWEPAIQRFMYVNEESARKLIYTAITRASNQLFIYKS